MTLTLGTNFGFCAIAPSGDPTGNSTTVIDRTSYVVTDTSPSTAVKIVEMGWWCQNATEEANFELGLYAADGAVVPDEAGTLLEVSRTNAKGTGLGWKTVTGLNWTISSSTDYWLGVQLDTTTTATNIDRQIGGGTGYDVDFNEDTLNDPFGGGTISQPTFGLAVYAVWEAAVAGWKAVAGAQINIGDVWKTISAMQLNIGDSWKAVTVTDLQLIK